MRLDELRWHGAPRRQDGSARGHHPTATENEEDGLADAPRVFLSDVMANRPVPDRQPAGRTIPDGCRSAPQDERACPRAVASQHARLTSSATRRTLHASSERLGLRLHLSNRSPTPAVSVENWRTRELQQDSAGLSATPARQAPAESIAAETFPLERLVVMAQAVRLPADNVTRKREEAARFRTTLAMLNNYRENDTASPIPRRREYRGCTLTFVLPPGDASNLTCSFEFAASIAHPISAPIPVQTAAAPV
jgi:hypothetical protein